jgi:hypothetical protein
MALIQVLPEATPVGPLSARSDGSGRKQRTRQSDPELPFEAGPMKGYPHCLALRIAAYRFN